jgi:hypothetical protein
MFSLNALSSASDVSPYLDKVVLPGFFVLLGAAVGFLAARTKDMLDERRIKAAFLRAMRVELSAMESFIEESISQAEANARGLASSSERVTIIVGTFRNEVFSTQLGNLRDVSDPLLMEIVRLYANLDSLDNGVAQMNGLSGRLVSSVGSQERAQLCEAVASCLSSVIQRMKLCLRLIRPILEKLPRAPAKHEAKG